MKDLDQVFAYTTDRRVAILDRRLGLLFLACQIAIAGYVVIYQIILKQGYLATGTVTGLTRLQLKQPSLAYQWPNNDAPYCTNGTANNSTDYAFPAPGFYSYIRNPTKAVRARKGVCRYSDARFAVPDAGEPNAVFLPTRTTIIRESVIPANECGDLQNSFCTWRTVSSSLSYLADAEMFTLLIDHSFGSDIGISKSSLEMQGELLGPDGKALDPCGAYRTARFASVGCPSFIQVGDRTTGANDIIAIKSLINAAGIETLDEVSGTTPALSNSTKRYDGIVVLLSILYTNHYLPSNGIPFGTGTLDSRVVKYGYRVNVIPEQEYKAERVYTVDNIIPSAERIVYNEHGVRIVVTQVGQIGTFDFQTLLINLTTAIGLLSVAVLITDFFAFNICPQRHVFRQYATRKTVDMSDVLDAEDLDAIKRFEKEDDLIDPLPKVFVDMLAARTKRMEARKAAVKAQQDAEQKMRLIESLTKAKTEIEAQIARQSAVPSADISQLRQALQLVEAELSRVDNKKKPKKRMTLAVDTNAANNGDDKKISPREALEAATANLKRLEPKPLAFVKQGTVIKPKVVQPSADVVAAAAVANNKQVSKTKVAIQAAVATLKPAKTNKKQLAKSTTTATVGSEPQVQLELANKGSTAAPIAQVKEVSIAVPVETAVDPPVVKLSQKPSAVSLDPTVAKLDGCATPTAPPFTPQQAAHTIVAVHEEDSGSEDGDLANDDDGDDDVFSADLDDMWTKHV